MDEKFDISDEQFSAFLDGTTSAEETRQVFDAMRNDPILMEMAANGDLDEEATMTQIPMSAIAAVTDSGNLCTIRCEEYILDKYNVEYDHDEIVSFAKENDWLKDDGTALYNVGRVLETKGFIVNKRYYCSLEEVKMALDRGSDVIVVLSSAKLNENVDYLHFDVKLLNDIPDHSVVVLRFENENVVIYDPSSDDPVKAVSQMAFNDAWMDSQYYMVKVLSQNEIYDPQPICLDDVELSNELIELREAIAENAHEVWAKKRMDEGWTFGPERDDANKYHPDLVPYSQLPDSEKQYDRDMAFSTIKLAQKIGYDLIKKDNSMLYKLCISLLHSGQKVSCCPNCGATILELDNYCHRCGTKLKKNERL